MPDLDPIIKRLRTGHPDREGARGCRWWSLVRDAVAGDGGFAATLCEAMTGRYGEADIERQYGAQQVPVSYVVRYPRERLEAYVRRVKVSTYVNYVGPVVREYAGHLSRRQPQRDASDPAVTAWWASVDGAGVKVDAWMKAGAEMAQEFGWAAAIIDRPAGDLSPSEAQTFARWLQPEEVVDWDLDATGALAWIRLGSTVCVRDPWSAAERQVEVYTTWTPESWRRIVVEHVGEIDRITDDTGDVSHDLGRVPVALLYWSAPSGPGKLYGPGQADGIVSLALEHFNLRSELREWERGQCFGILCVQSASDDALQKIKVGVHGGIRVEPNMAMPAFVAPPVEVGAHLMERLDGVVDAIYDAANLERTSGQQGDAQVSGVSRAYKFQRAGAQLRAFAANLQAFELDAAALVARWAGASAPSGARVQYPQEFDVADLGTTLTVQFDTLSKADVLVPEIARNARLTVARSLNPDASPEQAAAIDAQVKLRADFERQQFDQRFTFDPKAGAKTTVPTAAINTFTSPYISANEVRAALNLPPVPGGDVIPALVPPSPPGGTAPPGATVPPAGKSEAVNPPAGP